MATQPQCPECGSEISIKWQIHDDAIPYVLCKGCQTQVDADDYVRRCITSDNRHPFCMAMASSYVEAMMVSRQRRKIDDVTNDGEFNDAK